MAIYLLVVTDEMLIKVTLPVLPVLNIDVVVLFSRTQRIAMF